jgi:hypothetical protein
MKYAAPGRLHSVPVSRSIVASRAVPNGPHLFRVFRARSRAHSSAQPAMARHPATGGAPSPNSMPGVTCGRQENSL